MATSETRTNETTINEKEETGAVTEILNGNGNISTETDRSTEQNSHASPANIPDFNPTPNNNPQTQSPSTLSPTSERNPCTETIRARQNISESNAALENAEEELARATIELSNLETQINNNDSEIEKAQLETEEAKKSMNYAKEWENGQKKNLDNSLELRNHWTYWINYELYEATIGQDIDAYYAAKNNAIARTQTYDSCKENLDNLNATQTNLKAKLEEKKKQIEALKEKINKLKNGENGLNDLTNQVNQVEENYEKLQRIEDKESNEYKEAKENYEKSLRELNEKSEIFHEEFNQFNNDRNNFNTEFKKFDNAVKDFKAGIPDKINEIKTIKNNCTKECLERNKKLMANYKKLEEIFEKQIEFLNNVENIARDVAIGLAATAVVCFAWPAAFAAVGLWGAAVLCIGAGTAAGVSFGAAISVEEALVKKEDVAKTIKKHIVHDAIVSAVDSAITVATLGLGEYLTAGSKVAIPENARLVNPTTMEEIPAKFSQSIRNIVEHGRKIPLNMAKNANLQNVMNKNLFARIGIETMEEIGGVIRPVVRAINIPISKVGWLTAVDTGIISSGITATLDAIARKFNKKDDDKLGQQGQQQRKQHPEFSEQNNSKSKRDKEDEKLKNSENKETNSPEENTEDEKNQNKTADETEGTEETKDLDESQDKKEENTPDELEYKPTKDYEYDEKSADELFLEKLRKQDQLNWMTHDLRSENISQKTINDFKGDKIKNSIAAAFVMKQQQDLLKKPQPENFSPISVQKGKTLTETDEISSTKGIPHGTKLSKQANLNIPEGTNSSIKLKDGVKSKILSSFKNENGTKSQILSSFKDVNNLKSEIPSSNKNENDLKAKILSFNKTENDIKSKITSSNQSLNRQTNGVKKYETTGLYQNANQKLGKVAQSKQQKEIQYTFLKNNVSHKGNQNIQESQFNLCNEDELLQELIDQEFSPFEPYRQALSPITVENENISSGASQQIENLIQKSFAKEILNINGLENSNKVSFDELKNYQATSVLQSSRNGKQTNNGVTNSTSNNNYIYSLERVNGKVVMKKTFTNEEIKQLSFPNESNRDTSDKNFVPTSTTQSKFSQPIALLPPPNICKIEDSFAKVKINIRTRRQNESLIFDEKIALKTRHELTLLLKKLQKEDLEFFLLIMKQYNINDAIWKNEKLLADHITKRQLSILKTAHKITSYRNLLKFRIYNVKAMLTFLLTNLLICEADEYEEKEEDVIRFLASLDPVILKAINPTKIFANILISLKKCKYFDKIKAQRKDKCEILLKEKLLLARVG